jgi:hypothetical protein
MAYVRKTRNEWRLHIDYGQGFEHEVSEDTLTEINARCREYRENCPEYPRKITGPHRVKVEAGQ